MIASVHECVEKSEPSLLLGMLNGTPALEDGLVYFFRMVNIINIWPRNSTPKFISKKNENIHTKTCAQTLKAALFVS